MDRKKLIFQALLAKEAGRTKDTLAIVRQLGMYFYGIDQLERKLIADAYKARYEECKSSLENLQYYGDNADPLTESQRLQLDTYIEEIQQEIQTICYDMINLLENYLLPQAIGYEAFAIYFSLKGDYKRYLVSTVDDFITASVLMSDALAAYESAYTITEERMSPVDPTRLGVILNYAVFLHDTAHETQRACALLEKAINTVCVAYRNGAEVVQVSDNLLEKCEHNLIQWRNNSGVLTTGMSQFNV